MALSFIKKVFTFGREKPVEEKAPEEVSSVEVAVPASEEPVVEPSVASEVAEPVEPPSVPSGHLPHEGEISWRMPGHRSKNKKLTST
ncbi:hypothetical protein HB780_24110 [Rhizobium lusitanum]|nr:hypothetical protein [Rhizobium lusitanum]QND48665.1 hypothetical protein HB780_24110 [Rhizobium lusitanum]